MSRPIRSAPDSHLNLQHRSADGSELNAGDLPLPIVATPFTSALTIEQWLENLQLELRTLQKKTNPNPALTRLGASN